MRIAINLAIAGSLILLLGVSGAYSQVITEPLPVNAAQYDAYHKNLIDKARVDFLQKSTLSDTIALPFFDDFSSGDASWALSQFYFAVPIRQIWFWGNSVGRAYGNQGLSLRTPNRGGQWNQETSFTTNDIKSLDFLGNSGNGWSCGSNGWLAQTSDSGQTWQSKTSPAADQDLVAIQFMDAQKGVLADSSGLIYRTTDGGTGWQATIVPSGFKAKTLFWKYSNAVFAAGDSGRIARSIDDGQNWTVVFTPFAKTANAFNKITFTTANVGMALGDSGLIYRTQDGGNYWFKVNSNTTSDILDVDFAVDINTKIGWATGRFGLLLGTTDGGYNWSQIPSGTLDHLYCVRMITEYRGWIGTSNGRLLQVIIDPFKADSKAWERNSGTYINNTRCVDPISFGVATFDGLNARGLPYSTVTNALGACDSLMSINLDVPLGSDPVYVSFYWQNGGFTAEVVPDDNDSLVLQFKSIHNKWVSVWQEQGTQNQITTPFRYKSVLLADSFKHQGFQFRFINFGNQNANYDTWNLDYVRVDTEHSPADSSAVDVTITKTPTRLLKDFHAYPLDQFNGIVNQPDYFSPQVYGQVRNLNPEGGLGNNVNGKFQIIDEATHNIFIPNTDTIYNGLKNPVRGQNALTEIYVNKTHFPLQQKQNWTTLRYGVKLDQDADFNAFSQNDASYGNLNLSTYMAYDDGSAELSRGVDGNLARGAVRFFLERADTITDIQLYFPRGPATQTQVISFLLMVYSDIDTGNNTADELFRISYILPPSDSLNKFDRFSLRTQPIEKRTLQGGKPFYIGWQQNVIDNGNQVRLGCDVNSSNPRSFYYNSNAQWRVYDFDSYPLMIRPDFGIETPTAVKASLGAPRAPFYPNPSRNTIRNREAFSNLEIYNALGQNLQTVSFGMAGETVPHHLQTGLYILKWQQTDGQWVSQRLMVE